VTEKTTIWIVSWIGTLLVLAVGFWLSQRFGSAVMWAVLLLILAVLVTLQGWMGSKAARARLELQENFLELARGKSIHELTREHPDLFVRLGKLPEKSLEAILETLDETQARDLLEGIRDAKRIRTN